MCRGGDSFCDSAPRPGGEAELIDTPVNPNETNGMADGSIAGVFTKKGEYWAVGISGTTVLLRDAKGLNYIAKLLVEPGRRVSVAALAIAHGAPDVEAGPQTLERARSAVTKRIRDALQKIEKNHPQLGRHLRAQVRTGYECSYRPDPDRPVVWDL